MLSFGDFVVIQWGYNLAKAVSIYCKHTHTTHTLRRCIQRFLSLLSKEKRMQDRTGVRRIASSDWSRSVIIQSIAG